MFPVFTTYCHVIHVFTKEQGSMIVSVIIRLFAKKDADSFRALGKVGIVRFELSILYGGSRKV